MAEELICSRCGARFGAQALFCQNDGERLRPLASDPMIGLVILGQFRVEERLGEGGMGYVYAARQLTVGRRVAIKFLHPDLARDREAAQRLHREATLAAKLEHPNLVRILLSGELTEAEATSIGTPARPYLVMELLEGRRLSDELHSSRIGLERGLDILIQLARAVGEAHRLGIVHRDIKPDNVMLLERSELRQDFVKLLDFGIARSVHDDGTRLTQQGTVVGTARYVSPEGALGKVVDARGDVYSLAVLGYELFTGMPPFDAKSPAELLLQHVEQDVDEKPLRAVVPQKVADILLRNLAKEPRFRHRDGTVLAEALDEARGRRKSTSTSQQHPLLTSAEVALGQRPSTASLLAAFGAGLAVVVAWWVFNSTESVVVPQVAPVPMLPVDAALSEIVDASVPSAPLAPPPRTNRRRTASQPHVDLPAPATADIDWTPPSDLPSELPSIPANVEPANVEPPSVDVNVPETSDETGNTFDLPPPSSD